jgi:drug/metabolite transporter (DMT)-like permease
MAWFGYAYAVSQSSIALTITISEAYIVLAALLGVVINRERLRRHQVLGAALALGAVVVLAYISV